MSYVCRAVSAAVNVVSSCRSPNPSSNNPLPRLLKSLGVASAPRVAQVGQARKEQTICVTATAWGPRRRPTPPSGPYKLTMSLLATGAAIACPRQQQQQRQQ